MRHTIGPWYVDHKTLKNACGESIANSGNNRKVYGRELDASLKLAAAAPTLLCALNRVIAHGECIPVEVMQEVRAAIAKATSV